jgi:hypothetical protein
LAASHGYNQADYSIEDHQPNHQDEADETRSQRIQAVLFASGAGRVESTPPLSVSLLSLLANVSTTVWLATAVRLHVEVDTHIHQRSVCGYLAPTKSAHKFSRGIAIAHVAVAR